MNKIKIGNFGVSFTSKDGSKQIREFPTKLTAKEFIRNAHKFSGNVIEPKLLKS